MGGTPLVEIPAGGRWRSSVRVLAKLEWFNPAGSVKCRAARSMLRDAASRGLLEGRTVLDASSGNTGIALAMLGAGRGLRVELVMPSNVSPERIGTVRAHGATVVFSDPLEGSDGAIRKARELAGGAPGRYCYLDQYNNEANPRAHEETTAPEIWDGTAGEVTHFVAAIGTGGTVMGTGRGLRRRNPRVRVIAAEPDHGLHGIEGLKHMATALRPGIYREEELDGKIPVGTEEAYALARALARAGFFVGHSSGAALAAAARVAGSLTSGVVVTVFPDGGARYLSTVEGDPERG